MRLVLGYLVQRTLLWSFVLTSIAFSLLSLCQFLLTERVHYGHSLSHALYFASLYAGVFVIVQWRKRRGDTLIQGLGYPKWSLPIPIGLISGAMIICALSQVQSIGLTQTATTQINWRSGQNTLAVNRTQLSTNEQRAVFDKVMAASQKKHHHMLICLVALLIPIILNLGIVFWTSHEDTWTALLMTTTTFAAVEFWSRSYG